jgi:hypothetical protein
MALEKTKPQAWKLESLTDFLAYLDSECANEMALFRGHREDWPLLPRIGRLKFADEKNSFVEREAELYWAFRREAVSFLRSVPSNHWDWLAIAHHHGLPTRLLDWTRNPLAGLWFATREPAVTSGSGVLWVFIDRPMRTLSSR